MKKIFSQKIGLIMGITLIGISISIINFKNHQNSVIYAQSKSNTLSATNDSEQHDQISENVQDEPEKKQQNDKVITDPNIIWKNVNSMQTYDGKSTTDGIFVNYEESTGKYYDLLVCLTANLAENGNAKSALENYAGEELKVKIVNANNNKEVTTKTAKHYLGDNGKHNFDFLIKPEELNLKNEIDGCYNLEIYNNKNELIGTFKKQYLSAVENPANNDSLKIQTVDGTETTDSVTIFNDQKQNLHVMLHPKLHSLIKIKQDKPSVFKGQNSIKIDFVDENGEVKLSKNAVPVESFCEKVEGSEFRSKQTIIEKSELEQNLNINKSYTLKFYAGDKLIGTKFVESLKPRY